MTMKKRLSIIIILLIFTAVFVYAEALPKKEIYIDDVTTKNFLSKMGYLQTSSIETVCSYDFCSYFDGENVEHGLELFTREYLTQIDDEEVKAELRIKGIKITKVVMYQ